MGWTRGEIINDAYGELAIASYVFDLSPEELQFGARRLELMMATWAAQGVVLPYAFAGSSSIDLDQDSGLPLIATEAVCLNLATRIAASKGKALAASTKAAAKAAYDALLSRLASDEMQEQQLPNTLPRGAGSKAWPGVQQPFMPRPDTAPLQIGADGGLEFLGG